MLGALRGGQSLSRAAIRAALSTPRLPRASFCISNSRAIRAPVTLSSRQHFHASALRPQQAAPAPEEKQEDYTDFTQFQELADNGLVSPAVTNTLAQRMNITTMTDVQRLTINETLDGADVIAQARTGTGKTLAFLIPIIQRVLKDPSLERRRYGSAPVDIRALIISPTRELAEQIAAEAKKVVSATNVRVQTAVGGTGKREGLNRMRNEGCHILVGTPGRLKDLLSDPYARVDLKNIEVFVLDEADRLLDIGFAPEIEEIQSYMPPREERQRQTLMFSATVPKSVVGLVKQTLRPDFKFIRTIDPNELPTHERIPQKYVVVRGLENRLPALVELAHKAKEAHEQDPASNMPFKAIVYFGSTSEVSLAHEIFQNMRGGFDESKRYNFKHPLAPLEIIEMHSKLTQSQRTRNSARFKSAKSALLFSSDVTARGMHFPDVSHVIQFGLPSKEDDYVHRIGRTGRAGKPGQGWLFIGEESLRDFRRGLGAEMPIKKDNSLETASIDMSEPSELPAHTAAIMKMIHSGVKATPFVSKAQAYLGMFGVLRQGGYRDPQSLVDALNNLARYGWGLEELPSVSPEFVQKMALTRTTGLNIQDRRPSRDSFGGRSARGGSYHDRDPFAEENPLENHLARRSPRDRSDNFGGRRGSSSNGFGRDTDDFGSRRTSATNGYGRDIRRNAGRHDPISKW